jgi:hypothetical protein
MLAQALSGAEQDFQSIESVIPFVGSQTSDTPVLPGGGRLLKTHESFRSKYRRAIYVARDGRDVAISYFYHQTKFGEFSGTLQEFLQQFLTGDVDGGLRWDHHVTSWLASPQAQTDDLLLLRYEDLLSDPAANLTRAIEFVGLKPEAQQVAQIVSANSFSRMREKDRRSDSSPKVSGERIPRVRAGQSQQWRAHLSQKESDQFIETLGSALCRLHYV